MSNFYPALLDLQAVPCLVVGGGEVALRKTESLLDCGAQLTVLSPELDPVWQDLTAKAHFTWRKKTYQPGDCRGFQLVISATNSEETNGQVARECKAAGILVNVVDDPQKCSFLVPSVLRRGDLLIAVSTGGASPSVAKQIRQELAQRYGPEYASYLQLLADARRAVLATVTDPVRRKGIFTTLADGTLLRLIQEDRTFEAKEWVKKCLS